MNLALQEVVERLDLTVIEIFKHGHQSAGGVARVHWARHNLNAVVKVAETPRQREELLMNLLGYQRIHQLGITSYTPELYDVGVGLNHGYILMEDCGDNFIGLSERAAREGNIVDLYANLCISLLAVYEQSVKRTAAAKSQIFFVIEKIAEQYELYLRELDHNGIVGLKIPQLAKKFSNADIRFGCISDWDFTPEDVYMVDGKVRHSDVHETVLGVPIIDLACFGGVCKDAHRLVGASMGYRLLYAFAVNEVASLLQIDPSLATDTFLLGRVLQGMLSARFRLKSEPEIAGEHFNQAYQFLEILTHSS